MDYGHQLGLEFGELEDSLDLRFYDPILMEVMSDVVRSLKVDVHRWFTDLQIINRQPLEFIVRIQGMKNHRLKISLKSIPETSYQPLNKLRSVVPNFLYTYGSFEALPPFISEADEISLWAYRPGGISYMIEENFNSVTLASYLPQMAPELFLNILLQISLAIEIAYTRINYSPKSLTLSDVIIRNLDQTYSLPYYFNQASYCVETDQLAVLTNISPQSGDPVESLESFLKSCLESNLNEELELLLIELTSFFAQPGKTIDKFLKWLLNNQFTLLNGHPRYIISSCLEANLEVPCLTQNAGLVVRPYPIDKVLINQRQYQLNKDIRTFVESQWVFPLNSVIGINQLTSGLSMVTRLNSESLWISQAEQLLGVSAVSKEYQISVAPDLTLLLARLTQFIQELSNTKFDDPELDRKRIEALAASGN